MCQLHIVINDYFLCDRVWPCACVRTYSTAKDGFIVFTVLLYYDITLRILFDILTYSYMKNIIYLDY